MHIVLVYHFVEIVCVFSQKLWKYILNMCEWCSWKTRQLESFLWLSHYRYISIYKQPADGWKVKLFLQNANSTCALLPQNISVTFRRQQSKQGKQPPYSPICHPFARPGSWWKRSDRRGSLCSEAHRSQSRDGVRIFWWFCFPAVLADD